MNYSKIMKTRVPVELQQIQKSQKDHGIRCTTLEATPDDFTYLKAFVPGPLGSPYEGGIFEVSIHFGEQYPFRPPTFKFLTPVYHPNIDNSGKICLDLLRMPPNGSYNPAITLESILLSIQLLLANPNPDDPLQGDAADLYKSSKELYNQKAKEFVNKQCKDKKSACYNEVKENDLPSREEAKMKKLKLSTK